MIVCQANFVIPYWCRGYICIYRFVSSISECDHQIVLYCCLVFMLNLNSNFLSEYFQNLYLNRINILSHCGCHLRIYNSLVDLRQDKHRTSWTQSHYTFVMNKLKVFWGKNQGEFCYIPKTTLNKPEFSLGDVTSKVCCLLAKIYLRGKKETIVNYSVTIALFSKNCALSTFSLFFFVIGMH